MKTTAFDVLVVNPNPLLNLVYGGDFVPGEVNRVSSMTMVAEGKGVNLARVLARHGHRVVATGFAGGHSGNWLRELVRGDGVEEAFVDTAAPLRVGFMASGRNAEHPTTVLPNGFQVTPDECQALLERVETLAGSARLVIASGSAPHPHAEGLYADLLALCERHSTPCWLDAYGQAMKKALLGALAPKLATPNRQEFDPGVDWSRVEELHITDGAEAIEVVSHSEGRWRVLPPSIRQVNPIGSGDCYLAGLAHGWLLGLSFEERLRYAAAAGAANALKHDVATITPREIEPLLEQVSMER